MSAISWFDAAFCVRWTETLLHFLWQGVALAALAVIGAALLRKGSSRTRYGIHVAALILMAACPPATFSILCGSGPWFAGKGIDSPPSRAEVHPAALPAIPPAEARVPSGSGAQTAAIGRDWRSYAPHAAATYTLGVLVFLGRLTLALQGGRRLRRSSEPIEDPAVLAALSRATEALGVRCAPAIACCRRIAMPTVVGVIRPAILVPLSFASGLTTEQVEMMLLHELAHVRRLDHVVNILQRFIEAALFFHPAVWLISRQIRMERENCCDDLVVAAKGRPLAYASSLLDLASRSRPDRIAGAAAAATLGAAGRPSQLRLRILRLLGERADPGLRLNRSWMLLAPAVVILAIVCANCVGPRKEEVIQKEDTEFAEMWKTYDGLVSELEARKAAYRKANPVFEKLDRTVRETTLPMLKRAELDRLRIVEVFPMLSPEETKRIDENYKKFDEKTAIDSIVWSVNKDIALEARKTASPASEEARSLSFFIARCRNLQTLEKPIEFEAPFEGGSLERAIFHCNLKEPLYLVTGLICRALRNGLPDELKAMETRAAELQEVLAKRANPEERPRVPPKYEDPYWASLDQVFGEVESLTDAFWDMHRQGGKSLEEILRELERKASIPPGADFRSRPVLGRSQADAAAQRPGEVMLQGLDLSSAPSTTRYEDLSDIFEDRPPGSKSFHLRAGVLRFVVDPSSEGESQKAWLPIAEVFYLPEKKTFYVERDHIGASTLHYYGPFQGDPRERLKNLRPVEERAAGESLSK